MIPGTVVGNRFVVESRIDGGGMGVVYRAADRDTGALAAVKLLRAGDAGPESRERFAREAAALARLDHPGFVRYLAHGTAPDGGGYLAMEWLDGESLDRRLARGPLALADALQLVETVARALAHAHACGLIHRDIKPSNLFVVDGRLDRIKVLDLGIVRLVDAAGSLTRSGAILGTPSYMAPEQVRGQPVDHRVDIYALGCVLHECLTGKPAFAGADMLAIFCKILLEETPRLGTVPGGSPELAELVAGMLAKERDERPGDCTALLAGLAAVREARPGAGEPVGQRSGITTGERQLMSVVLSAPAPDGHDPARATTVRVDDGHDLPALAAIAARFGGRLDALAAGAVVVTLPSRGPATDLAERAARCALAFRAATRHTRVAVATGRAHVSGRRPTGEVLDRVARLLEHARPDGEARIDEITVGLLGTSFEVGGDHHGLTLAGEREPVRPLRRLLGKPTSCVGRAREQLTVEAVFAECAAELVPRAVVVTGPPGIGKSRLRYELVRKIESEGAAEVLLARAHPLHVGSPQGLLGSAIRRAAGVRDGEPPAAQQQRLRARVARHLRERDAQRVVEFIGELAGVQFPADASPLLRAARDAPMQMAEQIRRAVDDWLAAECGANPVVLVLEDLHWGDVQTVQLIDRALAAGADRPLLVLALARPEVEVAFPELWAGRAVTHIRLAELSRRAADKLVHEVLGEATDPAVVDGIVTRAAGNPFYLEELIRAVAEGRGGELPATVLAMVQARIEALPAEARRVLRAASIFGARFWQGGVLEIIGGDAQAGAVDEWLGFLERTEVIARSVERKFPDQAEYVFRHALFADGAGAMLTDDDHRVGHRLAGQWLERAGESDPRVLADHFERGGESARAAEWLLRAGERLLAEGGPEQARSTLARAEALGLPESALPRLIRAVYQVHRLLGRHGDTLDWVRARLAAAPGAEAIAALLEAEISALKQLDVRAVIERADAALAAAERIGDQEIHGNVLSCAAFAACRLGDHAAAERYAAMARAAAPVSGRARFHLLRAQMFVPVARDEYEVIVELSRRIRDEALALGDLAGAANESNNIAESLLNLGQPADGLAEALRAVELASASGHRGLLGLAHFLVARARIESGEPDAVVDELFDAAGDIGANLIAQVDICDLGAFYALERDQPGDAARVTEAAAAALRHAEAAGARHSIASLRAAQVRAAWRAGDAAGARAALPAMRAALVHADRFGHCHAALAVHEVLGADDEEGTVAAARARLLAAADRRRDPTAFLAHVRIHRRLLAISGGPPGVA